jgi:hypothetical protein
MKAPAFIPSRDLVFSVRYLIGLAMTRRKNFLHVHTSLSDPTHWVERDGFRTLLLAAKITAAPLRRKGGAR